MKIKNIIFIEDDPLDFEVYESIISKIDDHYKIVHYPNLDQAFFEKYSSLNTLVFLDINLEGIDGIDSVSQKLLEKNYYVLVHTSSDNPSDVARANKAGICGYFQKKIGHNLIKEQFEVILKAVKLNLIKDVEI